jgi:hypothetical protein
LPGHHYQYTRIARAQPCARSRPGTSPRADSRPDAHPRAGPSSDAPSDRLYLETSDALDPSSGCDVQAVDPACADTCACSGAYG